MNTSRKSQTQEQPVLQSSGAAKNHLTHPDSQDEERLAMIEVYCNGSEYLVVPYICNGPLWEAADPIGKRYFPSGKLLNEAIEQAIKISEEKLLQTRSINFWQLNGGSSIDKFARTHKLIKIIKKTTGYVLIRLARDSNRPTDIIEKTIFCTSSKLAMNLKALFTESGNLKLDWQEFETLEGNIVYFRLFEDFDFDDAEDGHTDAYQVYQDSNCADNYLAFMIDSGYESSNAEDIKTKWQQYYGELLAYSCQKTSGVRLQQIASARTADKQIRSYFYADEDNLLEVIYEIDLTAPAERIDQVKTSFEKLISTIQMDTLYENDRVGCFLVDERTIVHQPVKYCLRVDPSTQTWHGWDIKQCWNECFDVSNQHASASSNILEAESSSRTATNWNGWVLLAEPEDEEYCSNLNNFILSSPDAVEELCPAILNIHSAPYGTNLICHYEGKEQAGFADYSKPNQLLDLSEILFP